MAKKIKDDRQEAIQDYRANRQELAAIKQEQTKREAVIANRLKMVGEGDTYSSIAQANNLPVNAIQAANPGVVTVSPGHAIKLPQTPITFTPQSAFFNNGQAQFNPAAAFNFPKPVISQTPVLQVSNPQAPKPPSFGGLSPDERNSSFVGSSSYLDPKWKPKPFTSTGAGGLSPDERGTVLAPPGATSGNFATPSGKVVNVPPRPAGGYTGNPNDPNTALWKQYWNSTAQLGYDPNLPPPPPRVMTRQEIWDMKARQRMKAAANAIADGTAGGGGSFSYNTSQQDTRASSPELVRSIVWGI